MLRLCFAATMAAALTAPSCSRVPPLAHTHDSALTLARAVASAVAQRSDRALEGMAVSEQEFRDHVWPSLPAARPERNLPFSYVWLDLHQKSLQGLQAVLGEYGGQMHDVTEVSFEGVRKYEGYRVHGPTRFVVRTAEGTDVVRLAGSFIEKDGRWKVFSYVVND